MNKIPLVSIIIPTTMERREFNISILQQARKQDYPNKEIIFNYKNEKIGTKRNSLCEIAQGEIIVNFDSDDMYMPDWVTKSVYDLIKSECDVTGLREYYNYDVDTKEVHLYTYKCAYPCWVAGATMVYWKKAWERNHFLDISEGEDGCFIGIDKPQPLLSVYPHKYYGGFAALLHKGNSPAKDISNKEFWHLQDEKTAIALRTKFALP